MPPPKTLATSTGRCSHTFPTNIYQNELNVMVWGQNLKLEKTSFLILESKSLGGIGISEKNPGGVIKCCLNTKRVLPTSMGFRFLGHG